MFTLRDDMAICDSQTKKESEKMPWLNSNLNLDRSAAVKCERCQAWLQLQIIMLRHNIAGQTLKFAFHFFTFTELTGCRRTKAGTVMLQICSRRMLSVAPLMLTMVCRPQISCEIDSAKLSRWLPMQMMKI